MNLEDDWIDKLSEIVSRPSKRRRMNGPPNLSFLTLNSDSIKNKIMFLVDISQETEMQKLLIRAETYTHITFMSNLKIINPLICSQYGWINPRDNVLECQSCKEQIILNPDMTSFEKKTFISTMKEQLSNKHDNYCPWRDNPISFTQINPVSFDNELAIIEYNDRKTHLHSMNNSIPVVSLINSSILKELIPSSLNELCCLILALYGWDIIKHNNQPLLYCKYCNSKRLPSQFMQCDLIKDDSKVCIVFSSENEKNYFNQYNRKYFDPNLQHKWYCPFICSYEDFKKGYIRLYEILYPKKENERNYDPYEAYQKSISMLDLTP